MYKTCFKASCLFSTSLYLVAVSRLLRRRLMIWSSIWLIMSSFGRVEVDFIDLIIC
jgi:hypothetical protein